MNPVTKMAWRNVWRNPRRSILTMAAIGFACVLLIFMLSWQNGSYYTMIQTSVGTSTGHLQIQAEGYLDDAEIRTALNAPAEIMDALSAIPGIEAYAPRAEGFALASSDSRSYGIMINAIDPDKESTVTTIRETVRNGEYLQTDSWDEAIIGAKLAKNLGIGLGDEIVILGQGYDGSVAAGIVRIRGIIKTGMDELDRVIVYVPLPWFQAVYSMDNRIHRILIKGNDLRKTDSLQDQIQSVLDLFENGRNKPVALGWWDIVPGLLQAIQLDLISGLIMYALLIFVVAFSILNTFLMAVFERTHEFGVLLSIGTTPNRLTSLLFLESLFLTFCGIILGSLAGIALTLWVEQTGIAVPNSEAIMSQFGLPERMYPKISLLTICLGPFFVSIITALSALYPALRVRKLKPVDALRAN